MLKLYKKIDGQLHYWETWTDKDKGLVHWGIVGETGQFKEVESSSDFHFSQLIQKEGQAKVNEGYAITPDDQHDFLENEFIVSDALSIDALEKRNNIGDGTMEVGSSVLDLGYGMLKLYKEIDGQLHYWETWTNEDKGLVHWGVVGEIGQFKEVESSSDFHFSQLIQKERQAKVNEGYAMIQDDQHDFLEVEFAVSDAFSMDALEKRNSLMEKLDDILGWTGLGSCSGGSIGDGTMEVGFAVVDFDIAKKVISEQLSLTEFADFTRIYRLDNEE